MLSSDFRNYSDISEYKNICNKLHEGQAGSFLGLRHSAYGYYPVLTPKSDYLSWVTSTLSKTICLGYNKLSKEKEFDVEDLQFFTLNAKNSLKHKKTSLKALYYLNGLFQYDPKMKSEIKAAIEKIEQIKSKSFISPVQNLILELRNDKETCDFTILCADNKIAKAHWCILKDLPFFKSRSGPWAEKIHEEKTCDLTQFPEDLVNLLLDILYTCPLSEETPLENLISVYNLADFLGLENIQSFVKMALQKRFRKDVNSFADAFIYTHQAFEYPSAIQPFLDFSEVELGQICSEKIEKLMEIFTLRASQNDPAGQCYLGSLYYRGLGIEKNKPKALELFKAAAEQDFGPALNNLACFYEKGNFIGQDMQKAIELYTKAAKQGLLRAQHNLAFIYMEGKGIEKDVPKAIELYTNAAEQGFGRSQHNLASCYWCGSGVERDIDKAIDLYKKAAAQGCGLSIEFLESYNGSQTESRYEINKNGFFG